MPPLMSTENSAPSLTSANQPQVISKLSSAIDQMNKNAPAILIPGNIQMLPVPDSMTQTIASATGMGALTKTVFFGNEDSYNVTPTDNGSGANSIVNTYSDGWSGKGYNKLFTAGTPQGVQFYGFTLQMITTATGVQNGAALNNSNPTILFTNLVNGQQIPRGIPLAGGQRNTQFQVGIMTVFTMFRLNSLAQLSYVVPAGVTATLTLLATPQS